MKPKTFPNLNALVKGICTIAVILFTHQSYAQVSSPSYPFGIWNPNGFNPNQATTLTDRDVFIGSAIPMLFQTYADNPSLQIETPSVEGHTKRSLTIYNTRTDRDVFNKNIVEVMSTTTNTAGVVSVRSHFIIDPIGKVHIGIDPTQHSIPTGFQLYVREGILTERVKVATQGSVDWPDYVFQDNYELMSLQDLENFVNENKHLPDVPSAQQVATDGIDLGDMDARLLRKIEELTLYVIDLKKSNDDLQVSNNQLRTRIEQLEK